MKYSKNILLLLLLLFVPLFIQAKNISGKYLCNNIYIASAEIAQRPDGSIKLMMEAYRELKMKKINVILEAIDDKKTIFEVSEKTSTPLRLIINGAVMELYVMSETRAVQHYFLLSQDKKLLKSQMKEKGLKSKSKQQIETLKNTEVKNEYASKPPVFIAKYPTSDFHAKNAGKVIFFSEKPEIGKEDLSKVKTKFKLGEEIWAVAYLPVAINTLPRLMDTNDSRYLEIALFDYTENLAENEKVIITTHPVLKLSKETRKNNYFVFKVIPSKEDATYNNLKSSFADRLIESISQLGFYNHKIYLAIGDDASYNNGSYNSQYDNLYFGSFELDLTGGKEDLEKWVKELKEKEFNAREIPNLPRVSSSLEAEIIAKLQLLGSGKDWNRNWKKILLFSDWKVRRDNNGFITEKYIMVEGIFSSEDGCGIASYTLEKKYLGDGQYSDRIYWGHIGNPQYLLCEKIK